VQLRHLETFLAIADSGTLTAAAAALFKTQAAVSQDLKALESALGVELVDRSGQRVQITPAGMALIPMARRVVSEVADTEAEMARIRAGERPVVRIACLPSVSSRVSALMAHFSQRRPDLRWSLITALRGAMIDGLRQRQFELVICEAGNEDDLIKVPLAREALKVVLPEAHPLAHKKRLSPKDLLSVPYIGLARGMGATIEAQRFFAAGEAYPTPVVEVNDSRLVLDLIARMNGFGVLPLSVLPPGSPFSVVATDPPLERQLAITRLAGRDIAASASEFADYLERRWSDDLA
jgi:DNA-binding transcriptional LysR family regulator